MRTFSFKYLDSRSLCFTCGGSREIELSIRADERASIVKSLIEMADEATAFGTLHDDDAGCELRRAADRIWRGK